MASALVPKHNNIFFETVLVGNCVTYDLQKQNVIFFKFIVVFAWICLLKAGITAHTMTAVAVFLIYEMHIDGSASPLKRACAKSIQVAYPQPAQLS